MHKHSTKLYGFVGVSRFASSKSFLDFLWKSRGESNVRIEGGLSPLPQTQKNISSINEEEKEEEEEKEREEEGVVMRRPSQTGIN